MLNFDCTTITMSDDKNKNKNKSLSPSNNFTTTQFPSAAQLISRYNKNNDEDYDSG